MDMPITLQQIDSYIQRTLSLLDQWKWTYENRATHLLLSDALSSKYLDILEKTDYESLNQLPLGKIEESWPQELVHFINECSELSFVIPKHEQHSLKMDIPAKMKKCISMKKEHEINRLAAYLIKHCQDQNLTSLYDIGSGLGYIDRMVATFTELKVIGVESDGAKIDGAVKLNKELLDHSKSSNITYLQCRLEGSTLDRLSGQLEDDTNRSCLTGLHACGDLSSLSLRLFLNVKNIKSMILMPCCYHKIKDDSSLPISDLLKRNLARYKGSLINTNFLRLASESTKERWAAQSEVDHNIHGFYVLARAVVELYLTENKYKVEKRKRRCVTKQHKSQWPNYVLIWIERHIVFDESGEQIPEKIIFEKLITCWTRFEHLIKRIEVYTCLQMCLQSVAECLLLVDRLAFLLEAGLKFVTALRITDPTVSPRSIAVVAVKIV